MSHILLIHPPSVFHRYSISAPVTMPLSIAYLAANLRHHGHKVTVMDALAGGINNIAVSYHPDSLFRGWTNEEVVARLMEIDEIPDAIGVATMFSQEWPHLESLINDIHAALPSVPIIIGGEHATATSHYILDSCPSVSFVARGEGEDIVVEFAEYLDGARAIEDISGLIYRLDDGLILSNPNRPRSRTPDEFAWPAWDLFNLEPYFAVGEGHGVERGRAMPILATRGCPYQCTFCSSPQMWTTRYVMRSPSLVLDEIEHYVKTYKVSNIDFFDLTAIIKKDWILEFCKEIKTRGLKFEWQLPSGTRSEALDGDVIREMALAGCRNLTYAPESGSEWTLKYIKKKIKLPKMLASIRSAKKEGISVKCNLVIGFPQEHRWDMIQTVWLAIRFAFIGVDDTGIYAFSPYPGSELYEYLKKKGRIAPMGTDYFASLMSFMKFKPSATYCENVGILEITFYRLIGMSLFYGVSYLMYPRRVIRSYRNFKNNQSDTVLEERLFGMIRRFKVLKTKNI